MCVFVFLVIWVFLVFFLFVVLGWFGFVVVVCGSIGRGGGCFLVL